MTRITRTQLETLLPHAGQGSADGESLVAPIVQSTTFSRAGLASEAQHCYSRQSNPTVAALERTLGDLEGAPPAVCYSTGLAAEAALFLTFLQSGDHVVCSRALYGGTTRILQQLFPRFGVETDFVDSRDLRAVAAALRPNTRLVFLETPSNPTLEVTDLEAVSALAHRSGALVAVDNTFLTPLLQQPLELGADFSVVSTTKFIEGHSAALGGAITARNEEYLERLRYVRTCTGGIQTPLHAWLTLQGIKTLGLRLERQSDTARRLAAWLATHPAVQVVHYPSFASPEQRSIAARQHLGAHGAVLSFELRSGADGARRVLEEVRLCRLVEHVGSVETLLTHSATMTHGAVPRAERERVGVTDGLLRLSVGLEPLSAIRADLERAIETADSREEEVGGVSSQRLIVLKFGGSVLRDENNLRRAVHEIYRWRRDGYRVVAVVSALFGTTDELSECCAALEPDASAHAKAAVLAGGDEHCAALLGLLLDRAGVPSRVLSPAAIALRAEGPALDAAPCGVATAPIETALEADDVVVVPGYVARDDAGRTVVLGRGGSDLSALFLASRLGADRCRLVKDVDGLYESDPARPGPKPSRFASVSWERALETDGSIVQHKALRFARAHGVTFELGSLNGVYPTRIGVGPDVSTESLEGRQPLRVALLGLGTVGGGVYALLKATPELFELTRILVRDPFRLRDVDVGSELLTNDAHRAIADADLVVETVGGTRLARECVERALAQGAHVVTANKSLVAERGERLAQLAHKKGGCFLFSAAVGGATPVLERLRSIAPEVRRIRGVLNGTVNYVLDRLAEGGPLHAVVAEAQERGFAEVDPSRDLQGRDALDKLLILAGCLGKPVLESGCEPLDARTPRRAREAAESARVLRQVSTLDLCEGGARLSVALEELRTDDPLAQNSGAQNTVVVEGASGASTLLRGRGAGRWPTAEAVCGDLLQIARSDPRGGARSRTREEILQYMP